MSRKTMQEISYGINEPRDVFEKLELDGEKITDDPHPYDLFDFFITASVLNEWIKKIYKDNNIIQNINKSLDNHKFETMPEVVATWIKDTKYYPNKGCDPRRHIYNCLQVCWGAANASKHYYWFKKSGVRSIDNSPKIDNFYKYFFTSTAPGLYIDVNGEYYNMVQLKNIVIQFYSGLLDFAVNG